MYNKYLSRFGRGNTAPYLFLSWLRIRWEDDIVHVNHFSSALGGGVEELARLRCAEPWEAKSSLSESDSFRDESCTISAWIWPPPPSSRRESVPALSGACYPTRSALSGLGQASATALFCSYHAEALVGFELIVAACLVRTEQMKKINT